MHNGENLDLQLLVKRGSSHFGLESCGESQYTLLSFAHEEIFRPDAQDESRFEAI